MPGQYDTGSPDGGAAAERQSHHAPSRRAVLSAAGRPAARAARGADAGARDSAVAEPIVVHLRDAASGEIDVFRGTSQVRLRDPELAARLVRASR